MKKIKNILVAFLAVLIGVVISFIYHQTIIEDDYMKLYFKISETLDNRTAISDGQFMKIEGIDSTNHFELTSIGFQIYKIEENNLGFIKTILVPGNLQKKETTTIQKIENLYNELYLNILTGKRNDFAAFYSPGAFEKIKNFPSAVMYHGKFHSIENIKHPTLNFSDSIFEFNFENIHYNIKYEQAKTYYKIVEKNDSVKQSLINSLSIGAILSLAFLATFYFISGFLKK